MKFLSSFAADLVGEPAMMRKKFFYKLKYSGICYMIIEEVFDRMIDCEVKVLPGGHLVLPPDIAAQIKTRKNRLVTCRIVILDKDLKGALPIKKKAAKDKKTPGKIPSADTHKPSSHRLSRFCGRWQDDRKTGDIIKEIYTDRERNVRAERTGF